MPSPATDKPPIGIVFDTAMGRIGDVLALAALYGLHGRGECRVAAISVSATNLEAAAYCEALTEFYLGVASVGRVLPVGLATRGPAAPALFGDILAKRDAGGQPLYPTSIRRLTDTADPPALIRNALTAQFDGNAAVILSGPATNLAGALKLHGVRELIAAKVKLLVVAAGAYPDGAADPNVEADLTAARDLLAGWPTPVVGCGAEVGKALRFPASSIETDFSWSPNHPVAAAYRAFGTADAPAQALAAALYAVRPEENYFEISGPGKIEVAASRQIVFKRTSEGTHRYLAVDASRKDPVIKAFTELASAKPIPPKPRK